VAPELHCSVCGALTSPELGGRRLRVGRRTAIFCQEHAETIRGLVQQGASTLAEHGLSQLTASNPILGTMARAFGKAMLPSIIHEDQHGGT